ncbi:hypothetical protein CRE_02413 [Caenorhabditis remanei]|uniref:Uncharacterized protein n=1 Tax=Caenorhabditis remanei TaxID=31234 RepID=E3MIN5_CAERE|nr:hypothetical protein CRE_02413 [Caenorhabditis remanei]
MSLTNSVPEILYAKVFANQHLLENILSYLSDDFRKNLDVRLVNKSINNTFLRLIRRNHQKMKIEYVCERKEQEKTSKDFIYINYRKVKTQDVLGYFIFLNTAVGAIIEKITTRRLWMLKNKFMLRLHDLIHSQLIGSNGTHIQSLIGLEEICNGCEKCFNIAKKCLEYGPLRFSTLQTMTYSKNYKKLHVTDKLFEDIAEYLISCDTLSIWINETRVFPDGMEGLEYDHRHMPREVIDMILRKWSVKSIQLNMIYFTNEGMCSVDWLQYDYFTPVRLNDPYFKTQKSPDLKFTHVDVEMSDSIYCVRDLGVRYPKSESPRGYANFIPNIRRLFPTDKISMDLSHWCCIANDDIEKKMSTILYVVSMEQPQNLSVDMKFFVESAIVKKLNEETKKEELFGIAPKYNFRKHRLQCYKKSLPFEVKLGPDAFDSEKWIGRRFQVEDTFNRFILNLDVYIKEKELEDVFIKELLQEYPNSFVGHFYN